MDPIRCANRANPAAWLVTLHHDLSLPGRILVYCDDCRTRGQPILVSIPVELVDEDMFVELYRLGYTQSSPEIATDMVFGEERPDVTARAERHLRDADS